MVTETQVGQEEAPLEADQAPPPEPQTETLPEVEEEGAAGTDAEAAAEAPLTAAEFDRRWQERENALRQQALTEARELEQRRRQSEEGRKAAEAANRAKLRDAVGYSLVRNLGITDIDDATADDIVDRVRGVESSLVAEATESAINEAITAAAARAIGFDPGDISPEAERYVPRFTAYMERLFAHEAVQKHVAKDVRRAWEADLPKLVDAEISKRQLKTREPEDLKRPDGTRSAQTDAEILADPSTPISTLIEIRRRQRGG